MARIKSTRTVKIALFSLRIYLVLIVILLGIKFVQIMHENNYTSAARTTATTPATNAPTQH